MIRILISFCLLNISFSSIVIAQITPSIQWSDVYNGIGSGIDMTNDAILDKNNNFYLAGRSVGMDGTPDFLVLKYSRIGELLSEIRFVSAEASWEEVNSIAVDSLNNLFCSGNASFGSFSQHAVIQKYSPNGNLSWSKDFYNNPDLGSNGIKVKVDNENNLIAGLNLNNATIIKYSGIGDSLWTINLSDDTSNYSINDIEIDFENNIYISIQQLFNLNSHFPSSRIHLLKVSSDGTILWHKQSSGNYTRKTILDKKNNVIQLISSEIEGDKLLKLNKVGDLLFEKVCDVLVVRDVGVDYKNNVIITGYDVTENSFDYITKKYSEFGQEIWQREYNGESSIKDFAHALAIDIKNNVYVTGSTNSTSNSSISTTIKYSNDGDLLWEQNYDQPQNEIASSLYIFVDDSSNILIGGNAAGATNGWDFFALKIRQNNTTGITTDSKIKISKFKLKQNYPNPFNPSTKIDFLLPKASYVKLEIFDINGKYVKELINDHLVSGKHTVTFNGTQNTSGIYFYKLTTNDYSAVKKALLIK